MRTRTRSPTPCASRSRHCANASGNRRSSPRWRASATASTQEQTPQVREATVDRAPGLSVRLKLTLSYAGFLMVAGSLMLAAMWWSILRYIPDGVVYGGLPWFPPSRSDPLNGFALLARLEAHVAEQQRFAANASHELRTPLAITQTLLDVARNDHSRSDDELVDRLHFVNTRAIDLTEALLLLSRADQRSFTREHVDLSLVAEEATETLLPLAEKRGLAVETSSEV